MKKIIVFLSVILLLIPKNSLAQKNNPVGDALAGALAGVAAASIVGFATVDLLQESMEQSAVEYYLQAYPDTRAFELSTSTLAGAQFSDLSNVSVVTFEVSNLDTGIRTALFAFTSYGWVNDNGVDFSKLTWMMFDKNKWNSLIKTYLNATKKNDIGIPTIEVGKLDNKGLKVDKDYVFQYPRMSGDIYSVSDFDDELKVVYNEKSLNLFVKSTSDLVKIREKAISRIHSFINRQKADRGRSSQFQRKY